MFVQDPFFWAFIGMFGLLAGSALVSGTKLSKNALLGFAVGQPYLDYKQRVKVRIIPRLPI